MNDTGDISDLFYDPDKCPMCGDLKCIPVDDPVDRDPTTIPCPFCQEDGGLPARREEIDHTVLHGRVERSPTGRFLDIERHPSIWPLPGPAQPSRVAIIGEYCHRITLGSLLAAMQSEIHRLSFDQVVTDMRDLIVKAACHDFMYSHPNAFDGSYGNDWQPRAIPVSDKPQPRGGEPLNLDGTPRSLATLINASKVIL